ncbi:NifU-like protein 1 [Hibiscus syriacus]|uniref:NifU-like protein 1 n=1 Tax=Hibiscus syriacus TaxID=106335 RepID=A0A6A3AJX3_HIBSY|nr:NifU-like protein 1 [Hibiscus syriacus]
MHLSVLSQQNLGSSGSYQGGHGRGKPRVQCQLCGKVGHLVDRCWYRFDQIFCGMSTNHKALAPTNPPSANVCTVASTHGCGCVYQGSWDGTVSVMMAECGQQSSHGGSASSRSSGKWFVDSGASHHVTLDATNVVAGEEYTSTGKLLVGNGNSLSISKESPMRCKLKYGGCKLHGPLALDIYMCKQMMLKWGSCFYGFVVRVIWLPTEWLNWCPTSTFGQLYTMIDASVEIQQPLVRDMQEIEDEDSGEDSDEGSNKKIKIVRYSNILLVFSFLAKLKEKQHHAAVAHYETAMETGPSEKNLTENGRKSVEPGPDAATGSSPGLYSSKQFELTAQNVDLVLEDVRPYLIFDGGNVDVLSVEDSVVSLKLLGACESCPSSTTTMKMGIERVLKEKFGDAEVNRHLDILRLAIKNYGGSVEVFSIDGGECVVNYTGPESIGSRIKAAIKEKFPDITNVLLTS